MVALRFDPTIRISADAGGSAWQLTRNTADVAGALIAKQQCSRSGRDLKRTDSIPQQEAQ
jgi:hypothetical protein